MNSIHTSVLAEPAVIPQGGASFRAWATVLVCTIAYVFAYIDRQILALLVAPIKHDLAITDTQFGLLSGLAFAIFYAVIGIPIATQSDSRSRSVIIAAGLFVWSAATSACGFARSFLQLFVSRIFVGAGEACISPATYSLIADLFPKERLGRALAVYSSGAFIGSGLGYLLGGWVIGAVGNAGPIHLPLLSHLAPWRVAFLVAGLPGVLLALIIALVIKDPDRLKKKSDNTASASFGEVLQFMRGCGSIFPGIYIGFSFCAMSLFSMMAWAPAYLMRTFHVDARTAGYAFGLVVLIGCTCGVLASGALVDLLRKRGRADSTFLTGVIGACGVALSTLPLLIVHDFHAAIAWLACSTFFATFALPTSTTAMQMIAPPHMRARISAMFLFCNSLIGLALGAYLVGMLNDHVYAQISASLVTVVAGASLFAAIILLVCTSALRRYMQGVHPLVV